MTETRARLGVAPVPFLQRFDFLLLLAALACIVSAAACTFYALLESDGRLWAEVALLLGAGGALLLISALMHRLRRQRGMLLQSSERFRQLAAMTSDWFWELDADFRFIETESDMQLGAQAHAIAQELFGTFPWDHAWLRPLSGNWETHRAQLAAHQAFSAFLVERVIEGAPARVMALRGEPVFGQDGAFRGYRGTGADITRRYRAEQALRESEARNRILIDSAPEAIFVIDADTLKVREANPSAERLFGMPREQLLAAPLNRFNALVQPGGRSTHEYGLALMEQALAGEAVTVEWLFRAADGRQVPAELRVTRLPGIARLLRLSVIDISQRRALEAEREHLQAQSRRLLERMYRIIETMPFACIVHDAEHRVDTWNQAAEHIFGYTADQVRGLDLFDLVVPPERRAEVEGYMRQRLAGAEPPPGRRVLNMTRDGRRIHCEWYGVLLADEQGAPARVVSMALDVSDRVKAEEALKNSEERFRRLTALSSDWYWELDTEYRFAAVTGHEGQPHLSIDARLGSRRWERPELRPVGFTWEEHRRDLELRKPFANLVIAYVGPDGDRAYWSISGEPVFGSAGQFTGYRGVGADITQRYRIYALRAGEKEMFEQLAAGAPLEQLMTLLCHAVEAALARRGVATLSVVKANELHLLAGPHLPEPVRRLSRVLPLVEDLGCCPPAAVLGRMVVSADIAADPRWESFRAATAAAGLKACWSVPVHGAGGRVIGTLAVYHEVTGEPLAADSELSLSAAGLAGVVIERSEAENALRENEARYRSLVEGAHAGVFVHRDNVVEYVNPAMVALMRAPGPSALLGLKVDRLIAPEFQALARGRRLAMGAGLPGAGFIEMQLVRLDQTRMDVEIGSSVVSRDRGLVIQAQVHDISARKWTEREIMRLNESLEQRVAERTAELSAANREMESFSYTVAHDLRAPLRAIDGFSRMLRIDAGERLDERMRRDLDIISSNARRMAELIDGLLEFSRFSRGEPARQRVATTAMVEAVILETPVPAGGMRPEFSVGTLPDMMGDAAMLRQVWVNLISNAVKFTSKRRGGKVEIEAQPEAGGVRYTVRDNGAGFDPAYADKLFGMFQRLHRLEEFEGTGVGLAIVKRVIERHGGRVWAEGRLGEGASFHFSLLATALAE